jgi:ribosomal protein L35
MSITRLAKLQTSPSSISQNVGFRSIHSSSTQLTWGGGKTKSHSGAGKRFFPVGKRKVINHQHPLMRDVDFRVNRILDSQDGIAPRPFPMKTIGVMYKRGQTGMRHLNSKMSSSRRMRLRGTVIERSGPKVKILSRLIGNRQ